ncbi:MAG TPA: substrate-binding domain-containing protein [Sulfolobales archaeon]|nr:substrate-binding domain-containing protein [Sulfolobales archaeon]
MVLRIRVIALTATAIIIALTLSLYPYYYNPGSVGREIGIRISTTTSLYATGLLSYLAEEFSKIRSNVRLDFIAVGTGAALKLAEQGDVCAVFVHAPSLEKQYIDKGIITGGRIIAYNYFIIVGPTYDPAEVNRSRDVLEAFRKIYTAGDLGKAIFITRGDNSGTNVKELSLWRKSGLDPSRKSWYKNCGCGMDQALVMANELRAYTLSDMGTYLQFKRAGRLPNLEILYANATDTNMINIYSIYIVSGCKGDARKYAEEFRDFVYSNQERLIGSYGVSKYGAPLFYPARDRAQEIQALWREIASERKE